MKAGRLAQSHINLMSILASDIKFLLSGGASNSDPDASLGGIISSTEVVDDTLENLFDNVTGAEHTAGDTEYRCIYVKNNSAESAANVKVYIETNTPGADSAVQIGLDLAGVDGTADTVADENTAPSPAVTFSSADGYANALNIGTVAAGEVMAVWIKRIITAGSTAQANDNAVIKVSVDTL
jgi:hypothetical protein